MASAKKSSRMTETRHTVTSLVTAASQTMRRDFPRVRVIGELSEYKVYGSGHAYFSIKDDAASLACMIWKRELASVPFEPRAGMEIEILGRLEIYKKNGRFQLIAAAISPVGAGAQEIALQQLREKYAARQIQKIPIPKLCHRVAVVTSPSGAVIRDILTVIDRRSGGLHITIYPCRVQGPEAPGEIASALRRADAGEHDVVILARGGGSAEDLASFNTATVADAIVASKHPVISAVGHETDFTLADDVADARAATPSQAAEMVSQDMTGAVQRVERARVELLRVPIRAAAARVELRQSHKALYAATRDVALRRNDLDSRQMILEAYDPATMLRRGYAIVRQGGHAVSSVKGFDMSETYSIEFADGVVYVRRMEAC